MPICFRTVRQWRALPALLLLVGCGDNDLGGEIRVPSEQQYVISGATSSGKKIQLPDDQPFNIHYRRSEQNPGAHGDGTSAANAEATGAASCQAQASNSGSASAEFRIGHRFINRAETIQAAQLEVRYTLEQNLTANPDPGPGTIARADLQLLVVDSQRRNLVRMAVAEAASDEAAGAVTTQDVRAVTVRFEPGRFYDVTLFGRASAQSERSESASADLKLSDLTLTLNCTPVSTQPAD